MKRHNQFLILLFLITCLIFTGCVPIGSGLVSYDRMEYSRPNMEQFASVLEESCSTALSTENMRLLEDAIWAVYDEYDAFYTNLSLAFIAHSRDLTDIYWAGEYAYCASYSATADAALDRLYRTLAQSPLREELEGEDYFGADYFDSFDGESIYDAHLIELFSKEAELCTQYQEVYAASGDVEYYSDVYFETYGDQMAQIYVELIALRQEIAAYTGYSSYPEFAYDFYYVRDYTPQQATAYLADIRAELSPLYRQLMQKEGINLQSAGETETFSYVRSMAKNMGGIFWNAFHDMEQAGVYDISYGEHKYSTSFEIYLSYYGIPYIFLSPTGTEYDKLAFAHEFGHFCSDYVTLGGSVHGVDAAEVISQGMEYLSLVYAEDGASMVSLKMADCLRTYVEQAAYASFEQQVYGLTGEDLTAENVQALYEQVCTGFGLDVAGWDARDYVCIAHFYETPFYIISYVLSNDAALQLYEMERSQQGNGVACFEGALRSTSPYFLAFLEEVGLESPFAAHRLSTVRQLLENLIT